MTLSEITSTIRAANGEVLLCGPTSFGFVVRAIVNGHSCRIIMLRADQKTRCIPLEPGSKTHIVSDVQHFQAWLNFLSPNRVLQAL